MLQKPACTPSLVSVIKVQIKFLKSTKTNHSHLQLLSLTKVQVLLLIKSGTLHDTAGDFVKYGPKKYSKYSH